MQVSVRLPVIREDQNVKNLTEIQTDQKRTNRNGLSKYLYEKS